MRVPVVRQLLVALWLAPPLAWARAPGWDALPPQLQRAGPWGLMWWQWLALPVLAALSLVLGSGLGAVAKRMLHRLLRHTAPGRDGLLLAHTAPALKLLFTVAAAALLLPALALAPGAHGFVRSLLGGLATVGAFWVMWRAVDVWAQVLNRRAWASDNPSARSLLSVLRNLARVFVAVTGVVATLAAFGYPVTTVLAGLGIGGIAIAFGAQKTIENLFGSIALATDQPFRVGDLVRVEGTTGNVERVGMRSTQIRTADRTLVSLPNGKLADMLIEDFEMRDRIRFAATIGLDYGTSEAQLRRVVSGIEALLRATPKLWPEAVVSSFAAFSASALEIEVACWFETHDMSEFRALRQQVLFGIMRIVEEAGTSFALPPRLPVAGPPPAGVRS